MKWGVRKEVYKSMNRSQRREQRKKYYKTPEGKGVRASQIGTLLGGPVVGIAARIIANKLATKNQKVSDLDSSIVNKGKAKTEKLLKNKPKENRKEQTDEEKIMELAKQGKIDLSKREYLFDENGKLFYVGFKD